MMIQKKKLNGSIITIHIHLESHNCNHIKYYLPYISVSYYVRILMHFLNEDFPHVTNKITWITANYAHSRH